jgi:hypothetical protein
VVWTGSGQGEVESSCKFSIELSGFMKSWETIGYLVSGIGYSVARNSDH